MESFDKMDDQALLDNPPNREDDNILFIKWRHAVRQRMTSATFLDPNGEKLLQKFIDLPNQSREADFDLLSKSRRVKIMDRKYSIIRRIFLVRMARYQRQMAKR
jgi:hypothetical protein